MLDQKISFECVEGSPKVWHVRPPSNASLTDALEWLTNMSDEIDAQVSMAGCLLIRGLEGLESAEDFSSAAEVVTPALRDYLGGTSPRTVVHGKVMTATYTPPAWSIILHQEMAYTLAPPDWISFFCSRAADIGGESILGDMRLVRDRLDPAVLARFEDSGGVQLRRTLPSPANVGLKPGVQKPWTEVFGTSDRGRVDALADENGWRAEWLDGETLLLWQDIVPVARPHPRSGRLVWCNQAHFWSPGCMMRWAQDDGRQEDFDALANAVERHPEMLDRPFLANGDAVPEDDALHVYEVLRSLERELLLRRHDLLVVDNLAFAHGRRAFAGERNVFVALADRPCHHPRNAAPDVEVSPKHLGGAACPPSS